MQRRERKGGYVMTISILFTAVLTLISGSLTRMVLYDAQATYRQENSMKAFFLAEAGAAEAFSILKQNLANKDNPDLFPEKSAGEGTYDVTILQPGGRVVIQSTGVVKGVERTVTIEVKGGAAPSAFDYTVFSNDDLTMSGNGLIEGSAATNDNMTLSGNAYIGENASAHGTITMSGNAEVAGGQVSGAPLIEFPTFDFNYYYNLAVNGGLYYSSGKHWSGQATVTSPNGVIYVNGNVSISGQAVINGTIIATGSISISGQGIQNRTVDGYPGLVTRDSEITLSGQAQTEGLLYSKMGNITMSGNALTVGQAIAYGRITLSGNAYIGEDGDAGGEPPAVEDLRRLTYHE